MTTAPASTAEALGRAFLEETAGDPRPWPDSFKVWADARDLDDGERYDVRVQVIRLRSFGSSRRRGRQR